MFAFFKSNVEKYVVSCGARALICWEIGSMSVSILGISHLFLWIVLFNFLESSSSLFDWSLFTVTAMRDMKFLSGQLKSFIQCFSTNNFLSSQLTLSWRLFGMRLPFWCLGWKSLWKLDLATWFFDLPVREIRLGKFLAICSLKSDEEEMVLTLLPCTEEVCVTTRPRWSNRSLSMRDLRPSATTVKVADVNVHRLLVMRVCIFPSIWIGSFEIVLKYGLIFSLIQTAFELIFITCVARDRLKLLHALPESTRRVVEMLPILIGILRDSILLCQFWLIQPYYLLHCCSQTRTV